MNSNLTNWSGHHTYSTDQIYYPKTSVEVQELVHNHQNVSVIGARHSFNDIADSTDVILSLENLNQVVVLDRERQSVTVEGGIRYDALSQYLNSQGYALHNLASLPDISVVGACATGTHGSGAKNGSLHTAISRLEVVNAEGELCTFSREQDGDIFEEAVVNLGGLGVVTKVTLDIVPAYEMRQFVYESLPIDSLLANFHEVMGSAYSVSLFLDFQGDTINQVWLKERVADGPSTIDLTTLGATAAVEDRHPIEGFPSDGTTYQQGLIQPWFECLTHFRIGATAKQGNELQSEYMVPREHAVEAFKALYALRQQIAPLLVAAEIRTIAADRLWMSPFYDQPSIAFHFTWQRNWPAVQTVLAAMEEALAPFQARPHWAKMFLTSPEQLEILYPKFGAFRELLNDFDPGGKFRNAYLNSLLD